MQLLLLLGKTLFSLLLREVDVGITKSLGEITLSFATCGTVHHWRAGSEVALET